eukprot:6034099-Ditylum_brightwellii.AAC.1
MAVNIKCFVSADHAGNQVTRKSYTGLIIVINMAPIFWLSKKQNTVEFSTFDLEIITMETAVEQINSL